MDDRLDAKALAAVERRLEPSRLAREDTVCHESMIQAEKRSLHEHRSTQAQRLLTGLFLDHLSYAASIRFPHPDSGGWHRQRPAAVRACHHPRAVARHRREYRAARGAGVAR